MACRRDRVISALAASGLCWQAATEAERRRVSWLYRSIRYTDQLARSRDGGVQRLEQHKHLIKQSKGKARLKPFQ